jgi:glutaminyl-tRNA synthetase
MTENTTKTPPTTTTLTTTASAKEPAKELVQGPNFIEEIIEADNASGKHGGAVVTRFPPEPNGWLHIGHAKSICLNFGLGLKYGGRTHLRFDDTNPLTEEVEYVESIKNDVKWLGFTWNEHLYYASDYFEKMYLYGEELIKLGKAYVCSLTAEQTSEYRGDFHRPGRNSPFRDRSVDENLQMFRDMRAGKYQDGEHTLRLKIDMAAGNPNLRDPPCYRIRRAHHHRTGDAWCIYPLYDYAHCISDAIEGITHSICTLEFESHRALYDWVLEQLRLIPAGASVAPPAGKPQQIEFARLKLTYTVMSKRKLLQLVNEKHVTGWDDPRMLTIAGLRRRGYTAEALRAFATSVGVTRNDSWIDFGVLEGCIRDDLNLRAPRAMCVLRPLKIVIENYPEGQTETVDVQNHPLKPELGVRAVPFGRELYIEREDFEEVAPKGFFRLAIGKEVRLRGAYFVTAQSVVKDAAGHIVEVRCSYDPATRGGDSKERKVKGTLHWVAAATAKDVTVRLFDRLFSIEQPGEERDFLLDINPQNNETLTAKAEPQLTTVTGHFQFERTGYFFADPQESLPDAPVWNRVVGLKDSWVKEQKKG